MVECEVSELRHGGLYEFALRMCNALERWSDWTPPTSPLRMELPAPVPGVNMEHGGLRVAVVSTTLVRLVWRPFCIPCASERTEPVILFGEGDLGLAQSAAAPSGGGLGGVSAEYEVVVRAEDKSIMAVMQKEGPAFFEDLARGGGEAEGGGGSSSSAASWIEVTMTLEPRKACSFEIRARLSKGTWGRWARSPLLPARIAAKANTKAVKDTSPGSLPRAMSREPATPQKE